MILRLINRNRLARLSITFILLAGLWVSGCKKTVVNDTHQPEFESLKGAKTSIPADEKMQFRPSDKDGNWLPAGQVPNNQSDPNSTSQENSSDVLCASGVSPSTYYISYKGLSYWVPCTRTGSTIVSFIFSYYVSVPATLQVNASNSGTAVFTKASLSDLTKTGVPYWEPLNTTFTDLATGIEYRDYLVTLEIGLPYSDFCQRDSFKTKLYIQTDCAAMPFFSTAYTSIKTLTPYAYKAYPWGGSVWSGSPNYIQFDAMILACSTPHCKDPASQSPYNVINVRKVGTTLWTQVIATSTAYVQITQTKLTSTTYEPISTSASYEMRFRSAVNGTNTSNYQYTDWSPVTPL